MILIHDFVSSDLKAYPKLTLYNKTRLSFIYMYKYSSYLQVRLVYFHFSPCTANRFFLLCSSSPSSLSGRPHRFCFNSVSVALSISPVTGIPPNCWNNCNKLAVRYICSFLEFSGFVCLRLPICWQILNKKNGILLSRGLRLINKKYNWITVAKN